MNACHTLFHKFPPVGFQEVPGEFKTFWVFTDSDDQRRQVLSFHELSFDASFQKPRRNEKETHHRAGLMTQGLYYRHAGLKRGELNHAFAY